MKEESEFALSAEGREVERRLWVSIMYLWLNVVHYLQDETIEVLERADPRVQSVVEEYFSDRKDY